MRPYKVYAIGRSVEHAYNNAILGTIDTESLGIATSRGFSLIEPPIRNVEKWIRWMLASLEIIAARKALQSDIRRNPLQSIKLLRRNVRKAESAIPKDHREAAVTHTRDMLVGGQAIVSRVDGVYADRVRKTSGWIGMHGSIYVFYGVTLDNRPNKNYKERRCVGDLSSRN